MSRSEIKPGVHKMEWVTDPRITPERALHLSDVDLVGAAEWWVQRLGLTDWSIEVGYVTPRDLDDGALGSASMTYKRRVASVSILAPEYAVAMIDEPYDVESFLVHELVHIVFAAMVEWAVDDVDRKMGAVENGAVIEQPVDRMSRVLVDMRRNGGTAFAWELEEGLK